MLIKQEFIDEMTFIEKKQAQQEAFIEAIEEMSPNCYCDAFIYSDYETHLVKVLEELLQDKSHLIEYKLYEFDQMNSVDKEKVLLTTPEVENWSTVYDYLIQSMEENKGN